MKLGDNSLHVGNPADLIIIDTKKKWVVDRNKLHGKSKEYPLPWTGADGKVKTTILGGQVVFEDQ